MTRSVLVLRLERQIRDQGARLALVSEPESLALSFAQVGERIAAWETALRRAGVDEGQTAAIATGNGPAFVELFFALRSLNAGVLLLDDASPASVASKMGAAWILGREGLELVPGPDARVRIRRIVPERQVPAGTALIKLTSGSTLAPRGACFTEEALSEGIDHLLEGMELSAADRILVSIPLSHGYGFDNGVLSLAAGGTPLVLQPDVFPGALLRTIRDREVTFFPAVPALVRTLGQVAWPASHPLRRVISASAPLSREAALAFARASGRPVHQFFGSTETGGISFESRPAEPEADGTVGFPLPGVRIDLADDETVSVTSKANRFALLPEQPVREDVETGDRASWTPEGRLRLIGRSTLTANIGGLKVDLGALDAFFRGLPGVDDAAAVPVEDPARGHRVVAYVETSTHTRERLLELCRERLSEREVPSEIRVMGRLPRNARGKLDRGALLVLAGEGR
ncbi:MAG TPA: class I adenylate-forming enzyme family protein [Planctomycetota bacterium]|nr:class I adenylate-forming enzyme family protein [Planctomycetota bacterium]